MSISILLVEDHTIVRQGISALLTSEAGFKVVGEASTGIEALQLVNSLKPNVIVLDVALPDISGLEVARQIRQSHADTRIVILSMHDKEAYVVEALKSGASAYVLKDSQLHDLVHAIHQVVHDKRYLSPPLTEQIIAAYLDKIRTDSLDPYDTLTKRERQVLHLAARGLTNNEISKKLVISSRTVETHRNNLMRKLGLRSKADLVLYAMKRDIVPSEEE